MTFRTVSFPLAALLLHIGRLLAQEPAAAPIPPFPEDPAQHLERTSFQTGKAWSPLGNLRADVAMVYGIDKSLPDRVKTWKDRGYRVHLMTGVSWGEYQDYLYGRFDGVNHEDNAQMDRNGRKIGHGGDVWYMCPAENFGEYLCVGVQRALDAGVEAIHLEEPEFWARAGYSEGFKREWQAHFNEPWQAPDSSVDAQWKASKLKYFLYGRALQQVFRYVKNYNEKTGKKVRCYVPTHSLINYAHWCIVSPESSLARIDGCDGYIAQVWTGTARTPNHYRGVRKERTFETAFLEYGSMQNLVKATGRSVWYLNDPIEDNPRHDWNDYRTNWESTLVASLLQPDVWQYEVAPWPERIFGGRYPRGGKPEDRKTMPPEYASELQVVMQALTNMKQADVSWDCGTQQIGVLVSDSLMFQRELPTPSDPNMAHFYGLAMPLVKRGIPVTPVQLENVTLPGFLKEQRILLLSYQGQKPMTPDVHTALATWIKEGGTLIMVDDDSDPYNQVKEWWNDDGKSAATPRQKLFESLGISDESVGKAAGARLPVGKGELVWLKETPVKFALSAEAESRLIDTLKSVSTKAGLAWTETRQLVLRRGPFIIAAGLDESPVIANAKTMTGRFINLFDPSLKVQHELSLTPGNRLFLLDLEKLKPTSGTIVASSCKALTAASEQGKRSFTVEGVGDTPAVIVIRCDSPLRSIMLENTPVENVVYDAEEKLAYIRFQNEARPRKLIIEL